MLSLRSDQYQENVIGWSSRVRLCKALTRLNIYIDIKVSVLMLTLLLSSVCSHRSIVISPYAGVA